MQLCSGRETEGGAQQPGPPRPARWAHSLRSGLCTWGPGSVGVFLLDTLRLKQSPAFGLLLPGEAALAAGLEPVLSVKETANPFTNHLLSRSLMEKYLFKTIGQKEQLFYKQVTAVTSQNPRLDFLFLEPTTSRREEVGEKERWGRLNVSWRSYKNTLWGSHRVVMKHAMGGEGPGGAREGKTTRGRRALGRRLERRLGSVPWGGRRPDAQPAGLGLETCCFGDGPDTWVDIN